MTFIDFFAGVGGFRRGLELVGHKCIGFCEYDKYAVQSYRAIHNTEGEWYEKDIRTVRAADIPRADIWCAGFPCQDISIAGKQLGFKGKRSSLFFTVTGLIKDLEEKDKPTFLFFENVKNLLSVNRGFDLAKVFVELDEIGYDAEWCVLNSSDVIPQNRERIFIVGHLRGRNTRKVFPIESSNKTLDGLHRQVSNTLTTRSGQNNSVGTYVVENQRNAQGVIYQLPRGNNKGGIHHQVPTITHSSSYPHSNLLIKQIAQLYGTETEANPQAGRIYAADGISPSLDTCQGGNRMPKIAVPCLIPDRAKKRQNGRRFKNNNEPMFTLTSQDKHGVVIYNGQECSIRKLTPLECWRLQAWDDESFFRAFFLDKDLAHKFNNAYQKHKNNPVRLMQWAYKYQKMSDSQLYKQAGNGVTVEVIRRIGERLKEEQK